MIAVSVYANLTESERFEEVYRRAVRLLKEAAIVVPDRYLHLLIELIYTDLRARHPQAFGRKARHLGDRRVSGRLDTRPPDR